MKTIAMSVGALAFGLCMCVTVKYNPTGAGVFPDGGCYYTSGVAVIPEESNFCLTIGPALVAQQKAKEQAAAKKEFEDNVAKEKAHRHKSADAGTKK